MDRRTRSSSNSNGYRDDHVPGDVIRSPSHKIIGSTNDRAHRMSAIRTTASAVWSS